MTQLKKKLLKLIRKPDNQIIIEEVEDYYKDCADVFLAFGECGFDIYIKISNKCTCFSKNKIITLISPNNTVFSKDKNKMKGHLVMCENCNEIIGQIIDTRRSFINIGYSRSGIGVEIKDNIYYLNPTYL